MSLECPIPMEFIKFIPEQFTVKAHPALFEGERVVSQKFRHYIFQSTSTTDIHIQNIIPVYS